MPMLTRSNSPTATAANGTRSAANSRSWSRTQPSSPKLVRLLIVNCQPSYQTCKPNRSPRLSVLTHPYAFVYVSRYLGYTCARSNTMYAFVDSPRKVVVGPVTESYRTVCPARSPSTGGRRSACVSVE